MQEDNLSGANTAVLQRPRLEVVDIFRLHGEEYKNHHPLSPEQNV